MLATTNAVLATDDRVRLDAAAQQLSACTWLMVCLDLEPCGSDLCIGQLVPFMQHAIRASGVACHPAQTARLPMLSVRIATIAAKRADSAVTYVECETARAVSNPAVRTGSSGVLPGLRVSRRLWPVKADCKGSPVRCSVIS